MSLVRFGRLRRPSDPGPSRAGELFDPAGTGARPQVARDIWLSPQDLRHGPESPGQLVDNAGHRPERESPGSAGGHRGPSDTSASRPGELVDIGGPRTLARDKRERFSTPRVIRTGRKSSGTAGRPRRAHDPSESRPECCSSTQDLGPGTETPGVASQHCGPRYTGPSRPGVLVDPAGPRPQPESPGRTGPPHGPTDPSASRSGELVVPAGTGTRPRSPGTSG